MANEGIQMTWYFISRYTFDGDVMAIENCVDAVFAASQSDARAIAKEQLDIKPHQNIRAYECTSHYERAMAIEFANKRRRELEEFEQFMSRETRSAG